MAFTIEYVTDFIPDVAPKMVEAGIAVLSSELGEMFVGSLVNGGNKWSTGFTISHLKKSHTFFLNEATKFKANAFFDASIGNSAGTQVRPSNIRGRPPALLRGRDNPNWRAAMVNRRTGFIKKAISRTRRQVEDVMTRVFDEATGRTE